VNRGVARAASGLAAVVASFLLASPVAAAATVAGVLTGSGSTWDPSHATDSASGDGLLSFTLYRRGVPAALLRIGTAPTLELNRRGYGWAWSLDAATTTAAYQQARRGNSDLRLYDWSSGLRTNPGGAVNTPRWEYEPAVSGHWLVFARLNRAPAPDVRRILLENLQTNRLTELARFRGSTATGTLSSPQVNGDWVTWTSMSRRYQQSSVHRYQISIGRAERIPHPAGRFDYLSAVGPDGTVYFLRSRGGCGSGVTFESYTTGGVVTALGAMPAGRDGGDELFAAPQSDGSVSLYVDSYRCTQSPANGNIYVLQVPRGASAAGRLVRGRSAAVASRPKRFPIALLHRRRAIEGPS
jgi:hypothetical protein